MIEANDEEAENYNTALLEERFQPSVGQVSKYSNIVCGDGKISFRKLGRKSGMTGRKPLDGAERSFSSLNITSFQCKRF